MTKKEKAAYVMEELEALYPETPIPLDHTIRLPFWWRWCFRPSARMPA
jgi:hypothetical protein